MCLPVLIMCIPTEISSLLIYVVTPTANLHCTVHEIDTDLWIASWDNRRSTRGDRCLFPVPLLSGQLLKYVSSAVSCSCIQWFPPGLPYQCLLEQFISLPTTPRPSISSLAADFMEDSFALQSIVPTQHLHASEIQLAIEAYPSLMPRSQT